MSNKCKFRFKNTSAYVILRVDHKIETYDSRYITGVTLNKDYLIITRNFKTRVLKEKIAIETIDEFRVYRRFNEYSSVIIYSYRKQGV